MVACQEGHKEVAQLLLRAKASLDQSNKGGITPLMFAACEGQCEVAR